MRLLVQLCFPHSIPFSASGSQTKMLLSSLPRFTQDSTAWTGGRNTVSVGHMERKAASSMLCRDEYTHFYRHAEPVLCYAQDTALHSAALA